MIRLGIVALLLARLTLFSSVAFAAELPDRPCLLSIRTPAPGQADASPRVAFVEDASGTAILERGQHVLVFTGVFGAATWKPAIAPLFLTANTWRIRVQYGESADERGFFQLRVVIVDDDTNRTLQAQVTALAPLNVPLGAAPLPCERRQNVQRW